jgi:hypothetical protein
MPHKKQLIIEWNGQLRSGQKKLAHSMRTRIFQRLPAFYSKLDEVNDAVFLEPLLFAYFDGLLPDSIRLEQLLVGSIVHAGSSEHLPVFSDENGVIYLPALGYLMTGLGQEEFTLIWDKDLQCLELKHGGQPAVFDFELPYYARGTAIEITSVIYAPWQPFFEEEMRKGSQGFSNIPEPVFPSQETMLQNWIPQMESVFDLLGRCCPAYLEEIMSVIRRIVIFESKNLPSFSPQGLNGCVFLNCTEAVSEVSIISGLSVYTTQLQFYLLKLENDPFFRLKPDQACINEYSRDSKKNFAFFRDMEELFISSKQAEVLESCYSSKFFSGAMRHEFAGRLAHNRHNYQTEIDTLAQENILTDKGIMHRSKINSLEYGFRISHGSLTGNYLKKRTLFQNFFSMPDKGMKELR